MDTSFQEKSTWASLIVTSLAFAYYFSEVIPLMRDPKTPGSSYAGVFIVVVIVIILAQILSQSILAILFHRDAQNREDERAKIINLKATQLSHWILVSGVWLTILGYYFSISNIVLINMVLFFFIVSEISGYVAQLVQYRRGV